MRYTHRGEQGHGERSEENEFHRKPSKSNTGDRLLDPCEEFAVWTERENVTQKEQGKQGRALRGANAPRAPNGEKQHGNSWVVAGHERLFMLENYAVMAFVRVKKRQDQVRPAPTRHGPLC